MSHFGVESAVHYQRHESIKSQSTQHHPNTNAHSINPKSMLIATDFLLVGFSSLKTFTLRSMPLPVILRGAEGKVAESIIQKITLALRERGDRRRRWVRAGEEHFPPPLIRPDGYHLQREKVFLHLMKQWILQLRASPACRMT